MATFRVSKDANNPNAITRQSAIFKVGDDCRQDAMALQLIAVFKEIFAEAGLPVWLHPYRVVATAPGCGIIEVIPNALSRDQLGREQINSLGAFWSFRFGPECRERFQTARRNFIASMSAYSLLTFLLAIRDRHNGNIMIAQETGHLIHIDFGFMLDIGPGGVNFERSPFKLTSEMVSVMGGKESHGFAWFRELCIRAFLACRPYAKSILQLVECMAKAGLPCFRGGPKSISYALKQLAERFRLDLNDSEAVLYMTEQVKRSCENVRTTIYDSYQYHREGIPY